MQTKIIKDPTYNVYAKGGNVETSKNTLDKKDLEQLAKKDKEVLEFDAIEDQLQELIFQHKKEAPEISFKKWLDSKPDSFFKRMEFKSGGNVIQFPVDLTKYRTEPKIRKINISGELGNRTIDSLNKDERDLVNRLLRISLGKEEK
tara:strand:- start:1157 stop:1594 length:438 start_codon:yes stop_codon:yes gene_type:complete